MFTSLAVPISKVPRASMSGEVHGAPAAPVSIAHAYSLHDDYAYVPGSYVLHDPHFIRLDLLTRFHSKGNRSTECLRRARARWLPDKYEQHYLSTQIVPDPRIEIYYNRLRLANS
jgi:hypothetical protein